MKGLHFLPTQVPWLLDFILERKGMKCVSVDRERIHALINAVQMWTSRGQGFLLTGDLCDGID